MEICVKNKKHENVMCKRLFCFRRGKERDGEGKKETERKSAEREKKREREKYMLT